MRYETEMLSTIFIYGLIIVGILNNLVLFVAYAYGVVLLYRKVTKRKKPDLKHVDLGNVIGIGMED